MSGYPYHLSECEKVGMAGGCNINCEVFLRGDCEVEDIVKKTEEYLNSELHEEEMEKIEDNKFNRWDIIDI